MVERSQDWIDEAENDLRHAKNDLKDGFYNWACFAAQQAAEKALKAIFQRLGAEAFGHSVSSLLQALPKHVRYSRSLLDGALELDKAYVASRYPNVHPKGAPHRLYTKTEAERCIRYAEAVTIFCKGVLPKVRPRRRG